MNRWETFWYVVAAYFAALALVRLMNRRRARLASELLAQAEAQRTSKKKKKPGQ